MNSSFLRIAVIGSTSFVLASCMMPRTNKNEDAETSTAASDKHHNLTQEGNEAVSLLGRLSSNATSYNIGLLRVTLGNPGSTYEEFSNDDSIKIMIQDFQRMADSSSGGERSSGTWKFLRCVKPEKGNWPQIKTDSPISECSSVVTNPRILRREAEVNFGLVRIDDSIFPKVEIAYPDRAEPWPVFVGSKPISGFVVLRYRPNIMYNQLTNIPLLASGSHYQQESRDNLKEKFELKRAPTDIADFSDLLVLKSRQNETRATLISAASAAGLVIGVSELIEAKMILGGVLSTAASRSTIPKIGEAFFKMGLGGTAALHETVRLLKLDEVLKSLNPKSNTAEALGIAIEVAHMSQYFAIADLTLSGSSIFAHSIRAITEVKIVSKLPAASYPRALNSLKTASIEYWPKITTLIHSQKHLTAEVFKKLDELTHTAASKTLSAIHGKPPEHSGEDKHH